MVALSSDPVALSFDWIESNSVLVAIAVILMVLSFLFCMLLPNLGAPRPSANPSPKRPQKPLQPIGYKYANLSRSGKFIGLARGKPYWLDSKVSDSAMGFHSYKSIELLQRNTMDDSYRQRGAVILEVLHYGEVTEYEDGFVSTGQRVLQVAPGDSYCVWVDGQSYCTNEVEFVFVMGRKKVIKLCRPHYAGVGPFLRLVPGRKLFVVQQWLRRLSRSEDAKDVAVSETFDGLIPSQ